MKLELQSGGVRLNPGQLLKVLDGAGHTVRALEGSIWITEENQLRDVVLESGDSYRLHQHGTAIVYALGGSASVVLN